jgi:hypothetical protein
MAFDKWMANESCGKVPLNTKLKNLGSVLCEMSSPPQEGTYLLGIPPSDYLYAKGRHYYILDLKLHHQFTWCYYLSCLVVRAFPICLILSQTLGFEN